MLKGSVGVSECARPRHSQATECGSRCHGFAALEMSPAFSATPIVTERLDTMARGTQPADEAAVLKCHWPKEEDELIEHEESIEEFLQSTTRRSTSASSSSHQPMLLTGTAEEPAKGSTCGSSATRDTWLKACLRSYEQQTAC